MSTALGIALGILLILALTAATGYFVAQEFAYVAVDRNALKQLAAEGDAPAERALQVTRELSFTLSAAQFGITVTALLVGYVSEPLVGAGIAELLDPLMSYAARLSLSVTAVLVFSTVVQMVFGELAPKNLAIARTVPLARALQPVDPDLPQGGRPDRTAVRPCLDDPAAPGRHRAGRGARAGRHGRGPHPDHRRVARGRPARRRPVGGARGWPAVPRARRRRRHDTACAGHDDPRRRIGLRPRRPARQRWSRFPVTGRDGDDIVGVAGIAEVLSGEPDRRATRRSAPSCPTRPSCRRALPCPASSSRSAPTTVSWR